MAKATIRAASGTAASSQFDRGVLGKQIEAAMVAAVERATEDGVTDPDEIRAIKLAARERVKDDRAAALSAPKD